eukprot:TRINITY_DN4713_c0_g1_i1.p4 TRINITY_DN4713_c0_g1~~TRINITY_DN4713_c0_g1_i1.p4  ORF type:complete len:100 (-),score=17.48 TRINITY_DN4713_c0_g1_i1:616-915(-)
MDGTPSVDIVALRSQITDFLTREAQAVDDREWDSWLALHEETVEYWVPAWDSEYETTSDPQAEMSLIYYNSRAGLEDRVFRLRKHADVAHHVAGPRQRR